MKSPGKTSIMQKKVTSGRKQETRVGKGRVKRRHCWINEDWEESERRNWRVGFTEKRSALIDGGEQFESPLMSHTCLASPVRRERTGDAAAPKKQQKEEEKGEERRSEKTEGAEGRERRERAAAISSRCELVFIRTVLRFIVLISSGWSATGAWCLQGGGNGERDGGG